MVTPSQIQIRRNSKMESVRAHASRAARRTRSASDIHLLRRRHRGHDVHRPTLDISANGVERRPATRRSYATSPRRRRRSARTLPGTMATVGTTYRKLGQVDMADFLLGPIIMQMYYRWPRCVQTSMPALC